MIKRFIKKKIGAYTEKRDLTTGSISKGIWYLALPMIIGNMLEVTFNLVDMFWVGRLGPVALASVAMSGVIMMILITFIIGINTGTLALVARFTGSGEDELRDNVAMQALILGFFIALCVGIVGYFSSPSLLKLLGAGPEVLAEGTKYLRVIFVGTVFVVFSFVVSFILRGAGDSVTPTVVLAFAGIVNVILDPLFIFGIGFPKMGVAGAALATVIAFGLAGLIGLEVLLKGRSHIHLKLNKLKVDLSAMIRIIRIGIPASAQMIVRSFMGAALMAIVAAFGTFAVAAYGIGIRLTMFVLMPGFGFAMAAATLVGQNLGAQEPERAEASGKLATLFYEITVIVIAFVYIVFAPNIISVFDGSPEVLRIGVEFLRITSWSFLFIPFGMVLGRAIMGAGDTVPTMLITLVSLWFFQIPVAYMLAKPLGFGLAGVWYAILAASVLQASLTTFWFKLGLWKRKGV